MNSLRNPSGNAEAQRRLASLRADTHPQWGKMTCAQMLTHCQRPLRVAAGELELKRGLVGKLLGGWAKKKFVVGDAPFGRNSPTDPAFRVQDARDFDAERATLVDLVRRFGEQGVATRDPHPFFGPLTPQEWDRLMAKHLDHHLRQFGA